MKLALILAFAFLQAHASPLSSEVGVEAAVNGGIAGAGAEVIDKIKVAAEDATKALGAGAKSDAAAAVAEDVAKPEATTGSGVVGVAAFGSKVNQFFKSAGERIQSLFNRIAAHMVKNTITAVPEKVADSLTSAKDKIQSAVEGATGGIKNAVEEATGGIKNAVEGATGGMKNAVEGAAENVKNAVGGAVGGDMLESGKEKFSEAVKGIESARDNVVSGVKDQVESIVKQAENIPVLGGLFGAGKSKVEELTEKIPEIKEAVEDSVKTGMADFANLPPEQLVEFLINKVPGFEENVIATAQEAKAQALGEKGRIPLETDDFGKLSEVLRENFGGFEGLIAAMTNDPASVQAKVREVMPDIIASLKKEEVKEAAEKSVTKVVEGTKEKVESGLKNTADKVKDAFKFPKFG